MTGRIGVLSAEGRAKGIDRPERHSGHLSLELARDGERGRTSEEVFLIVYRSVLGTGEVLQVQRRDLEHLPSPLGITGGDERRMDVEEATLVEEAMDGHSHVVAHTVDRPEGIGTRTQVRNLAEELEAMPLLLQRVGRGVGCTEHLDALGLELDRLPLPL